MNLRSQFCLVMLFAASYVFAQQPRYAVEASRQCIAEYQGHNYMYDFEVQPEGTRTWQATRKFVGTDDKGKAVPQGAQSHGTVKLLLADRVYTMNLSGEVGINGWAGSFTGSAKYGPPNFDYIEWNFEFKRETGETVHWKETCWPSASVPSSLVSPTATISSTIDRNQTSHSPTPNRTPSRNRTQNASGREEHEVSTKHVGSRNNDCDTTIVETVFGYFLYPPTIDLTTGQKQLTLTFLPYAYGPDQSGTISRTNVPNNALKLKPYLDVAPSILFNRKVEVEKPVSPPSTLHWVWDLDQEITSASETDGTIHVQITLPTNENVEVPLQFKVKGKPWWSFAGWVWENVLSKPQVSLFLLLFLIVSVWRGPRNAFAFLIRRLRKEAGLES